MNPIVETRRRMDIVEDIAKSLEGITKGVMLGGSMGFGQNYSVHEKSDIDLVVVTDGYNSARLFELEYFSETPEDVKRLFSTGFINMFWTKLNIRGVETNIFTYEPKSYANYCMITEGLFIYTPVFPRETSNEYGFDGQKMVMQRVVKPLGSGFIYERPNLCNGKYYSGVPRFDHLYSNTIMHQKDGFFDKVEKKFWKAAIKRLVLENGENADMTEYNLLNSHVIYQQKRDKFPLDRQNKILLRTKIELEEYKKNKL